MFEGILLAETGPTVCFTERWLSGNNLNVRAQGAGDIKHGVCPTVEYVAIKRSGLYWYGMTSRLYFLSELKKKMQVQNNVYTRTWVKGKIKRCVHLCAYTCIKDPWRDPCKSEDLFPLGNRTGCPGTGREGRFPLSLLFVALECWAREMHRLFEKSIDQFNVEINKW